MDELVELRQWIEEERKRMWAQDERIRALVSRIEQQIIEAAIDEDHKK